MGESRNFYALIMEPNGNIRDLNIPENQLEQNLDSNRIFIICDFSLGIFFVWNGKDVKDTNYKENAEKYAIRTQEQVKTQYEVDSKLVICDEGKEPEIFQKTYFNKDIRDYGKYDDELDKNDENLNLENKASIEENKEQEIEYQLNNLDKEIDKTKNIKGYSDSEITSKEKLSNPNKISKAEAYKRIELMLKENKNKDLEPELPEGVSYQLYQDFCDEFFPYGKDTYGKAFLMNQKEGSIAAHRMDMEYRCDWGALRKTGLGWRLNPTLYIACIFFIPLIIISPFFYYHYGHPELVMDSLNKELFANLPFIFVVMFMVKIMGYCFESFDNLLKPYGQNHESFKILWKDDLEYLKFEKNFFDTTYHNDWIKLGALAFFGFLVYSLSYIIPPENYAAEILTPDMPLWTRYFILINHLGVALLLFLVFTFLIAVFRGLFILGNLAKDRSKLSISGYRNMIKTIVKQISKSHELKCSMIDYKNELVFNGKTFYEFQRGNRRIGELLFNIAALLIFLCIAAGVGIFIVDILNLLPPELEEAKGLFSIAITIFGIVSFGVFVFPQLSLHKFLKEFKFNLIDIFSELKSRFEFIYYDALLHPSNIKKIHPDFKKIEDIKNLLNMSNEMIYEIRDYGTWSYDFPEILKVVAIALATLIPVVLDLLPI